MTNTITATTDVPELRVVDITNDTTTGVVLPKVGPSAWVFHNFCKKFGIYADRELFHAFANRRHICRWTFEVLAALWSQFDAWGREALIAQQDARDLTAADRYDDGEGLQHDPHFDACY